MTCPAARRRCRMRGIAAVHGGNAVEMQVHLLPGGQRPRLRQDFIHVHHTLELSRVPPAYQVDPVNDLRPVCPDCHAMIHRGPGPALPVGTPAAKVPLGGSRRRRIPAIRRQLARGVPAVPAARVVRGRLPRSSPVVPLTWEPFTTTGLKERPTSRSGSLCKIPSKSDTACRLTKRSLRV